MGWRPAASWQRLITLELDYVVPLPTGHRHPFSISHSFLWSRSRFLPWAPSFARRRRTRLPLATMSACCMRCSVASCAGGTVDCGGCGWHVHFVAVGQVACIRLQGRQPILPPMTSTRVRRHVAQIIVKCVYVLMFPRPCRGPKLSLR